MVRIVLRIVHVVTSQNVTTLLDHARANQGTLEMTVNKVNKSDVLYTLIVATPPLLQNVYIHCMVITVRATVHQRVMLTVQLLWNAITLMGPIALVILDTLEICVKQVCGINLAAWIMT